MGVPTWVFHQLFQTRQWLQEVELHEFQPVSFPIFLQRFRSSYTNEGGVGQWEVLLMAEILHHLGWCWNPKNNGINYQPQLVNAGFQPSTVCSAVMKDLGISKWFCRGLHRILTTSNGPQAKNIIAGFWAAEMDGDFHESSTAWQFCEFVTFLGWLSGPFKG